MRSWSVIQWLFAILAIGGGIAILFIAFRAMGIPIPPWAVEMGWVVAIVAAAMVAIGLLVAVWRSWNGGPPSP